MGINDLFFGRGQKKRNAIITDLQDENAKLTLSLQTIKKQHEDEVAKLKKGVQVILAQKDAEISEANLKLHLQQSANESGNASGSASEGDREEEIRQQKGEIAALKKTILRLQKEISYKDKAQRFVADIVEKMHVRALDSATQITVETREDLKRMAQELYGQLAIDVLIVADMYKQVQGEKALLGNAIYDVAQHMSAIKSLLENVKLDDSGIKTSDYLDRIGQAKAAILAKIDQDIKGVADNLGDMDVSQEEYPDVDLDTDETEAGEEEQSEVVSSVDEVEAPEIEDSAVVSSLAELEANEAEDSAPVSSADEMETPEEAQAAVVPSANENDFADSDAAFAADVADDSPAVKDVSEETTPTDKSPIIEVLPPAVSSAITAQPELTDLLNADQLPDSFFTSDDPTPLAEDTLDNADSVLLVEALDIGKNGIYKKDEEKRKADNARNNAADEKIEDISAPLKAMQSSLKKNRAYVNVVEQAPIDEKTEGEPQIQQLFSDEEELRRRVKMMMKNRLKNG
jgi:hypothetical protein